MLRNLAQMPNIPNVGLLGLPSILGFQYYKYYNNVRCKINTIITETSNKKKSQSQIQIVSTEALPKFGLHQKKV
jgi:hypothetical protein